MPRHDVTVVLPCAGGGSRLGLPFPKELAPLGPGRVLVDSSLDLIRVASAASSVRVLLLEDGRREQTAAYIRDRLPSVPLACVRQDPGAGDLAGAVMALRPWLGYANVLLLPDAVYEWDGDPVGEVANAAVSFGSAFGAVKAGPGDLAHLGALRVDDSSRVTEYEDKPVHPEEYDAAWVMAGFSNGDHGMGFLAALRDSASRVTWGPVTGPPVVFSPVTWLSGYRDCGTWDRYDAARREAGGV